MNKRKSDAPATIRLDRRLETRLEVDNLIGERDCLRRVMLFAEATIGIAAYIVREGGNKAEAVQLERDAAYCRTMRRMVSHPVESGQL